MNIRNVYQSLNWLNNYRNLGFVLTHSDHCTYLNRSHGHLHHTHFCCIGFRTEYNILCNILSFLRSYFHCMNGHNSYQHDCICFHYQVFYPESPESKSSDLSNLSIFIFKMKFNISSSLINLKSCLFSYLICVIIMICHFVWCPKFVWLLYYKNIKIWDLNEISSILFIKRYINSI